MLSDYYKYHGYSAGLMKNEPSIPFYRIALNEQLILKLQSFQQKRFYFEKDLYFGFNYRHLPEFRAIALYLKTAYLDLIVYRPTENKFVALYLADKWAYTCNPGFFQTESSSMPIFYIHACVGKPLINMINIPEENLFHQYTLKIGERLLKVPFYQTGSDSLTWPDPLDDCDCSDYYLPQLEVKARQMFSASTGLLRQITANPQPTYPTNFNTSPPPLLPVEFNIPFVIPLALVFTEESFKIDKTKCVKFGNTNVDHLLNISEFYPDDGVLVLFQGKTGIEAVIVNGPEFNRVVYLTHTSICEVTDIGVLKFQADTLLPSELKNATIRVYNKSNNSMCVFNNFVFAWIHVSGYLIVPKYASITGEKKYSNLKFLFSPFHCAKMPHFQTSATVAYTSINRKLFLVPFKEHGYHVTREPRHLRVHENEYPSDLSITSKRFLMFMEASNPEARDPDILHEKYLNLCLLSMFFVKRNTLPKQLCNDLFQNVQYTKPSAANSNCIVN